MSLSQDYNIVYVKSRLFAVRMINLCGQIRLNFHEYSLADQVLRSATSIEANISESTQAQSMKDFISKISISLKEAAETSYWIDVLYHANIISEKDYFSFDADCDELIKLLTSIKKTSKDKLPKQS